MFFVFVKLMTAYYVLSVLLGSEVLFRDSFFFVWVALFLIELVMVDGLLMCRRI